MLGQFQTQASQREFSFTDTDFRFLANLSNQKTGIVLNEAKRDMVYGRLARRLRALGLENFSDYCELLKSEAGADELPHLVNAITTNLTGFFREGHHFTHLRQVATEWAEQEQKRVRIWSAACSSGMEPYSIAMTLRSALPNIDHSDTRILATDIDSNMVQTGISGIYNAADVASVPSNCKNFMRPINGSRTQMGDKLKRLITYRQLNLLESWPMKGQFDAIFCRNVVIYFDKPTKQRLFARMAEILKPDGWLYIGHSENLNGISDRFELVGRTIYRRIS